MSTLPSAPRAVDPLVGVLTEIARIVVDAEADLPPDSSRRAILLGAGLRSSLRVPIRLERYGLS